VGAAAGAKVSATATAAAGEGWIEAGYLLGGERGRCFH